MASVQKAGTRPVLAQKPMYLLRQVLKDLCLQHGWTYAVFWRLKRRAVPRTQQTVPSRGNRIMKRQEDDEWVLMWEDGYLVPQAVLRKLDAQMDRLRDAVAATTASSATTGGHAPALEHLSYDWKQLHATFLKFSYQIYNYGEGLMGQSVSSETSEWVYNDAKYCQTDVLDSVQNQHPPGWGEHFASGIKTIAIIPVPGGAVQLGSVLPVKENPSVSKLLTEKFEQLLKIPGVFLPDFIPETASSPASISNSMPSASLPPLGNSSLFAPVSSSMQQKTGGSSVSQSAQPSLILPWLMPWSNFA